jgi:hypothetical protein
MTEWKWAITALIFVGAWVVSMVMSRIDKRDDPCDDWSQIPPKKPEKKVVNKERDEKIVASSLKEMSSELRYGQHPEKPHWPVD